MAAARQVREPLRKDATAKTPAKAGEFRGRNGEILKFRSTGSDQFEIPEDMKEPGWTYQWQAYTVYGEPNTDLSIMYANGWRYVPVDTDIGRFFCAAGENADHVLRGGLVLMERPAELTEMYVEETNRLTRMQYEGLSAKSTDIVVPDGFTSPSRTTIRQRALARASDLRDTGLTPAMNLADEIPDEE